MIRRSQDTMKHFFFPYNENSDKRDKLNSLMDSYIYPLSEKDEPDQEILKAYYDVTDIIYDKRFEQNDSQLDAIDKEINKRFNKNTDTSEDASHENTPDSDKKKHSRYKVLKSLWDNIEEYYKKFTTRSNEILYRKYNDTEQADK